MVLTTWEQLARALALRACITCNLLSKYWANALKPVFQTGQLRFDGPLVTRRSIRPLSGLRFEAQKRGHTVESLHREVIKINDWINFYRTIVGGWSTLTIS